MSEQERIAELSAIRDSVRGKIPNSDDIINAAILQRTSIAEVRQQLFRAMPGVVPVARPSLDLIGQGVDLSRYSLVRAIRSAAENGGTPEGYEQDVSREIARQLKQDPAGFWTPSALQRADNIAGTGTLGGNLVASNLLAGQYIELLRNRARVIEAGARVLSGLVGNVVIPSQNSASTAYWATAETTATTQSTPDFGQITLSPKCVTGHVVYSKLLLAQATPAIDALLQDDLKQVLSIAIDAACLHTTAGGPTPISLTTGIATVTNDAAGSIPTFEKIIEMETEVAADNAAGTAMAYISNSRVRGALKGAVKSTVAGSAGFIWETLGPNDDRMNGYRALVSNSVLSAQTVGTLTTVCSSIFFGDWSQLLIGTWGGTDIVVDYWTAAANRLVKLYAHNYVSTGVRHAESFAIMNDALTS